MFRSPPLFRNAARLQLHAELQEHPSEAFEGLLPRERRPMIRGEVAAARHLEVLADVGDRLAEGVAVHALVAALADGGEHGLEGGTEQLLPGEEVPEVGGGPLW